MDWELKEAVSDSSWRVRSCCCWENKYYLHICQCGSGIGTGFKTSVRYSHGERGLGQRNKSWITTRHAGESVENLKICPITGLCRCLEPWAGPKRLNDPDMRGVGLWWWVLTLYESFAMGDSAFGCGIKGPHSL